MFYNGSNHLSYAAFDLDTFVTDANGFFTLGNPGVNGVDIEFQPGEFGFLQNGADAVAVVAGNATSYPNGTLLSTANVIDAVVYDTDDADDSQLLALLNANQPQVNENAGGDAPNQSSGRCADGSGGLRNTATYRNLTPSPDAPNNCPPPVNSPIVISQIYGSGGNDGAVYQNDYVELYNKGGVSVDVTGWSLQYAAAAVPAGPTRFRWAGRSLPASTTSSSSPRTTPRWERAAAPNVTGRNMSGQREDCAGRYV